MKSIFKDTIFGLAVNYLSRNRLFAHQDVYDEELRQHYINSCEKMDASNDDKLEKGEEYILIDFLENDPDDPRNWSLAKRNFVTFDVCLLTFAIYIGSAIYTSGETSIEETFHISQTVTILGLTLYVLGYGIGPMLWSPLSEIPQIGRMPIYMFTLLVFWCFNWAVVYAKNTGMLLAFRFLTGFFGSPPLATGGATLGDMFRPSKRVYAMSIFAMANILGPTVGPVIGNFAAQAKGWQWPIWIIIWLSGFALVFLAFTFPETSAANILYRRTVRLRKLVGPDGPVLKCQGEIDAGKTSPKDMAMDSLVRPFTMCFTEPIVLALNLYTALIYAVLYCWLEAVPLAFEGIYGWSLGVTGLAYLGLTVGGLVIIPPYFYYSYKYVEPRFNENGELKPEIRLESAIVGSFCLPICLFWFGWTAKASIPWIVPIIGTSFFIIGAFLSFIGVLNYLGDAYPARFASISAGNDLFRSSFGAAFPLFATQMYETLGLDWGCSLLGFLSIVFIPVIFAIWYYGEKLRMRSKDARHDM